jgi:hypothetical protein
MSLDEAANVLLSRATTPGVGGGACSAETTDERGNMNVLTAKSDEAGCFCGVDGGNENAPTRMLCADDEDAGVLLTCGRKTDEFAAYDGNGGLNDGGGAECANVFAAGREFGAKLAFVEDSIVLMPLSSRFSSPNCSNSTSNKLEPNIFPE